MLEHVTPGEIALIRIPFSMKLDAIPFTKLFKAPFVHPYGRLSASSPTSEDMKRMLPAFSCDK